MEVFTFARGPHMNFFEHQAHARHRTTVFVLLFFLATVAVVAATVCVVLGVMSFLTHESRMMPFDRWLALHPRAPMWAALSAFGFVASASVYRMLQLSSGGGVVASDLGGTLVDGSTRDPRLRQLVNVVEETAIAAGVQVPAIYVLENEIGINAFAAGFSPSDAAITVSRGALTQLTREELQGVIGHEFSHILNGDMRLNTRLIGTLFGILAIGLTGRLLLRGLTGTRARDSGAAAAAASLGFALLVIGYVGVFFGRMIQAAVSRSRESLADASAVQFTRNPTGIAGSLKKIAVTTARLSAPKSEEVSHMLFADGAGISRLFATHPPILERIRAIEPYFTEAELKRIRLAPVPEPVSTPEANATPSTVAAMSAVAALSPQMVVASVGQLSDAALSAAAARRGGIPESLADAAHAPTEVVSLMLALMMSQRSEERVREIATVCKQLALPDEAPARVQALAREIAQLDPAYRLPLLEIAFPALRRRTPQELRALATRIEELAAADGEITVFEYVLARLLRLQLYELIAPRAWHGQAVKTKLYAMRGEVQALFSVLARCGNDDERAARAAYTYAVTKLLPIDTPPYAPTLNWDAFDRALVRLDFAAPAVKQQLIEALAATVTHDRRVTLAERELLRAVGASLHCPLPLSVPGLVDAGDDIDLTDTTSRRA